MRRPVAAPRSVGFHVSVAGGLLKAMERARRRGCDALQVFPSNPRGWARPRPDPAGERALADAAAEAGFPLFVHAPYLVNLAASDATVLERSRAALAFSLERAARFGAAGVVVHPGSARGDGRASGVARTAASLRLVLDITPVDVLLEPTAGSGDTVAGTVAEAAEVLDACGRHPRLRVCVDTCHLYAAGSDWTTPAGLARLRSDLAELGPDRVGLVHVNDSRDPLGSRRDRHARVGRGTIGAEPFRRILAVPELRQAPLVLETPGDADEQAEDVELVRSLLARPPRRS